MSERRPHKIGGNLGYLVRNAMPGAPGLVVTESQLGPHHVDFIIDGRRLCFDKRELAMALKAVIAMGSSDGIIIAGVA